MNTNHNLLSKHNATMGKQKQLTFTDSADAPMNEYLPAEELGKTAQYKEQIPVFSSLTEAQKIALTRRAHILGK